MRSILTATTAILLALTMTACPGKNSDESQGAQDVATTPLMDNACLTGQQNCNMNGYQTYQPYGFRPYPINPYSYGGYANYWTNHSGFNTQLYNYTMFCDCPAGTQPVYNNQFGLGCLSRAAISSFSGSVGYYTLPSANGQWMNIPQVSGRAGPVGRIEVIAAMRGRQRMMPAGNCHSQVAQSCLINQPQSCMGGQICRPTGQNSGMGVCSYR